jgi:hypothetical protein
LGIAVPTILRIGRYRFSFFSNERSKPSHVHVKADGDQAKFWLEPIGLASNYGFDGRELGEIHDLIEAYRHELVEAWYDHFS